MAHCELLVRRSPGPHLLCQAGRDSALSPAPAHTWAASISLHQLPAPPSAPSQGKFPEHLCQVRRLPRISYLPVPTPSPDTWSPYLTHLQLRAQYPTLVSVHKNAPGGEERGDKQMKATYQTRELRRPPLQTGSAGGGSRLAGRMPSPLQAGAGLPCRGAPQLTGLAASP